MKRLISILMIILMGCQSAFAADIYEEWLTGGSMAQSEHSENDGQQQYADAIAELKAIGVTEGLNFTLSENSIMNRGDFLSLVMNIELGKNQTYSGMSTGFADVMEGDNFAWAVAAALKKGIVHGNGNGLFEPGSPISFESAVKILVGILGYTPRALDQGGFSAGYLKQAVALGIANITPCDPEQLTMGEAAYMVLQAVNTDVLDVVRYGTTNVYEARENMTWLKRSLDTVKLEGTVEANEFTSLYTTEGIGMGKVGIEGEIYNTTVDMNACLGQNVYYYLKAGDTVVYAYPARNEVVRIEAEEIEEIKDRTLAYFKNDRKKTLSLPKKIAVIYNNVAYPDYEMSAFDIKSGYIEVIKNSQGDYAVVKIYDCRPVYVLAINTLMGTISDGIGKSEILYSEYKRFDLVDESDNELLPKDIKIGDILNMYVSADNRTAVASRSNRVIAGTVDRINGQGSEFSVVVDAREVKFSEAGLIDRTQLSVGQTVTLYLDLFGKAVYIKSGAQAGARYAYLIAVSQAKGFSPQFKFKIYDSDGTIKELESSSRFQLNNRKVESDADIPEEIRKGSAVLYETDEEGKIRKLYTPDAVGSPMVSLCDEDTRMFYPGSGNYVFAPESTTAFSGAFCVDLNTLMMRIPANALSASDKQFSLLVPSGFSQFEVHTVAAYTKNQDSNVAEFVVEQEAAGGSEISLKNEALVVTDMAEALNEDGDTVHVLELMGKNIKGKEYTTADGDIADDVEIGDLVVIQTNGLGEIAGIRKIIDLRQTDAEGDVKERVIDAGVALNLRWYSNLALFQGYIYSNCDGVIRYAKSDTAPNQIDLHSMLHFNTKNLTVLEINAQETKHDWKVAECDVNSLSGYLESGKIVDSILYVKSGTPMMLLIYN